MSLEQFIAETAEDAARQIRARLGPDAVVVQIRSVPGRWFGKRRLEVLARAPDRPDAVATPVAPAAPVASTACLPVEAAPRRTSSAALLESLGLLPVFAAQLSERIAERGGADGDVRELRAALAATWRACGAADESRLHVFVGPAGAGKTTVLCQWLTREVLGRGRSARVWRLDGTTANTAEALSAQAELLGVPVERSWSGAPWEEAVGLVDVPGRFAPELPGAQVHLVLNGAYESAVLVQQARQFRGVHDIIVTHLDEEPRWGKLWNVVLGSGCPIRYLTTGQNIPSDFVEATATRVLARLFPSE